MHEWALAESVIKRWQEDVNLKDKKIVVCLGGLQDIDFEIFKFAMDELLKQYNTTKEYRIEKEEPLFKCNVCGKIFNLYNRDTKTREELENIHFIPEMVKAFVKCPQCQSIDYEIIKGRGVSIKLEE